MTVARTNSSIDAPITATNLENGLKQAMQDAGFGTHFAEYTVSSKKRIVWKTTYNNAQYGNAFTEAILASSSGSFYLSFTLYWFFNASNNTGSAEPLTTGTMTLNTSTSINFVSLNGNNQFRMVLIIQGTKVGAMSLVRPAHRPAWWTDNAYPYFFMSFYTATQLSQLQVREWRGTGASSLHPFGTNIYILRPIRLNGLLPNNKRQVVASVQLQTAPGTNQGLIGQFDADIVHAAMSGASPLDMIVVSPGTEEYLILDPGDPTYNIGGFAVRIT